MNISSRLAYVATAAALFVGQSIVQAAPAPPPLMHIRGTVQSVDAKSLTITTATGVVKVGLPAGYKVVTLVRASKSAIKPGTFLGIASVTQPNGAQRAVEIAVFPEAMRGAGEGNYAWDYPGGSSTSGSKMTNGTMSKMTNGTVTSSKMTNGTMSSKMTNGTVTGGVGSTLTLKYNGIGGSGSQSLIIPRGIPIVTFRPGTPAEVKTGAHVFVFAAKQPGGAMSAARVMVGSGGVTPPM